MTIITEAVRAGCETFYPKTCLYPDCVCPTRRGDDRHGLETAARHAAEAMREIAAQKADECAGYWATAAGNDNADFTPSERRIARGAALADNAVAHSIRSIPTEEPKT